MSTADYCLLCAGLLPYLAAGLAKAHRGYDNSAPRAWLARQDGWRARANAAQANAFEAFPLFATAVLLAEWRHAPQGLVDGYALAFIAARAAHLATYLAGYAVLRSVVWLCGIACVLAIFRAVPLSPM
jgi:uncharacterized MAPEG superfamily protein